MRRPDLPAMGVNDNSGRLNARVVLTFFASKLRSYGERPSGPSCERLPFLREQARSYRGMVISANHPT